MKENELQRLIIDWLNAKKIWNFRYNVGAMKGSHKGKSWFVRFGKPGVADYWCGGIAAKRTGSKLRRALAGRALTKFALKKK
jgi:hypothetical protein